MPLPGRPRPKRRQRRQSLRQAQRRVRAREPRRGAAGGAPRRAARHVQPLRPAARARAGEAVSVSAVAQQGRGVRVPRRARPRAQARRARLRSHALRLGRDARRHPLFAGLPRVPVGAAHAADDRLFRRHVPARGRTDAAARLRRRDLPAAVPVRLVDVLRQPRAESEAHPHGAGLRRAAVRQRADARRDRLGGRDTSGLDVRAADRALARPADER
mmetsp:Transcript_10915/g.32874  ORF Transcript_10915/g.32874 Transcript_10915/m.32874 type:complete len:216 (+) Transcript_10915:507-1154(+)